MKLFHFGACSSDIINHDTLRAISTLKECGVSQSKAFVNALFKQVNETYVLFTLKAVLVSAHHNRIALKEAPGT